MPGLLRRKPAIGVIELHGTIGAGIRPGPYYQLLDRVERSPRIGVVLLDIDSPGGSVTGSEDLYLKVGRIAAKKPVVAFVRGAGASGAYLVACAATRIVALPSALVGSVGVISLRPMLAQLMERLGVGVSVNKSGPLKDMGAFYRPSTGEEETKLQGLVDELYGTFLERVATGRKMPVDQVRQYATGEVFTGARGVTLGLVDETGDFDAALDAAASLGNVPRRALYLRPPRPFRMRLLGRFASWAAEGLLEEAESLSGPRLWYR
ncbi:MAG: signal peptide peptidase SppA [Chloroflexi bacterium]|nr:signal peptide peptidase SppA [Chloroflexota bacterium]